MKIHEYQAKELLAAAGANVPKHIVCKTPDEAAAAFDQLDGGGVDGQGPGPRRRPRGRATRRATPDKLGGVKFVTSKEKARPVAEAMLKHPLVTKQTGPDGQTIQHAHRPGRRRAGEGVLRRHGARPRLGVPVLMASAEGGMDIEEVAATTPGEDPQGAGRRRRPACSRSRPAGWPTNSASPASRSAKAEKIMHGPRRRCSWRRTPRLAEINPLAITKKGDVVVLDAKIDFDDNALFRHKDIEALRDLGEENPAEVRAGKANLNYIQLDGNIGCLVNGAGLAMATMDIIKYHGGEPGELPRRRRRRDRRRRPSRRSASSCRTRR